MSWKTVINLLHAIGHGLLHHLWIANVAVGIEATTATIWHSHIGGNKLLNTIAVNKDVLDLPMLSTDSNTWRGRSALVAITTAHRWIGL